MPTFSTASSSAPILIWQPGGGVPVGPVSNPPVYSQAGTTQLVEGQAYVDVVFGSTQTDDAWVLVECVVVNEIDAEPLNIWPGIITDKAAAGFRLQLNGMPDSSNYYLHWAVSGVNIAPAPATTFMLTGPAAGGVGVPSTFTVHLPASTTGTAIVTPSDGGGGGAFSPATVTLTTGTPSTTFTYTPASGGTKTISVTNTGGLVNPVDLSFLAIAYATGYSMSGPSSGYTGMASTPFTVTLTPLGFPVPSTVTVTPSDGGGGGTFTPTSVALTTAAPSATFTYTAASTGTKTIGATNNGGLTDPTGLSYVVTTIIDPSTIAGLKLWLKADSLALSDGAALAAWNDSSGNGTNFAAVFANGTYKTNIINGKPVVRFAGAGAYQNISVNIITSNYTIFVVASAASTSAGQHDLWTIGGVNPEIYFIRNGVDLNHTHYDGGFPAVTETGGVTVGQWNVMTADWNGSNIHLWRNGTLKGTTGTTLSPGNGANNMLGGEYVSGTKFWDGDIAETLIYDTALSGTDRDNVTAYLQAKYGL